MAIYHLSAKIISRGNGSSAVGSAAYRSGQKLKNEYSNQIHDYTTKGGVIDSRIYLPENAPKEFYDRETLWNSVEKVEKSKNAQLAREIEVALPREFTMEENSFVLEAFIKENFVREGMCADVSIHDTGKGNPHAHIMLTMRPLKEDGTWGAKSKKEYLLDKNGERYKTKSGAWASRKINAVDWDRPEKLLSWRESWANICNAQIDYKNLTSSSKGNSYLGLDVFGDFGFGNDNDLFEPEIEKIDHRSYKERGIEQIPTIHMGPSATAMESKGKKTELGERNREIIQMNKQLAEVDKQLKILESMQVEEEEKQKSEVLERYAIPFGAEKEKFTQIEYENRVFSNELRQANPYDRTKIGDLLHRLAQIDEQRPSLLEKCVDLYLKAKNELSQNEFKIFLNLRPIVDNMMKKRRSVEHQNISETLNNGVFTLIRDEAERRNSSIENEPIHKDSELQRSIDSEPIENKSEASKQEPDQNHSELDNINRRRRRGR